MNIKFCTMTMKYTDRDIFVLYLLSISTVNEGGRSSELN